MLDQEEYEKAEKQKKAMKVTKRIQKAKKITCGECRFYVKETTMCDYDWPGVIGKLTARGARTDHAKNPYCGMRGSRFMPIVKNMEEAVIESEEPRKNKPGPKPKGGPGQGS